MFAGILQSRRRRGRGPLLGSGSGSVAAPRSTGARWSWIYWICFFADEMITDWVFLSAWASLLARAWAIVRMDQSNPQQVAFHSDHRRGLLNDWRSAIFEVQVEGWWWPSCDDHVTTRVGCNPLQIAREPTGYSRQIKWNHCESILWEILSFNIWGK